MDAENLFRLKHEFRSLANLEHENFVRFGELASEGSQLYFTMERVYGPDFLRYVRPHDVRANGSDTEIRAHGMPGVDEQRLRPALAQLVESLAALHEAGQIHRDVKPSNVLVTPEGRVVLLDFGVTTGFGTSEGIIGTPAYMAPEQILGEELTPATDWYAVGAMLYASLSGEVPFEGEVAEILQAKLDEDVRSKLGADTPDDLRLLCLALLERDASARPGIDEIRERLGLSRPVAQVREVFVGREQELRLLREGLARARTSTQSIVVCGEAGMGKSALVERFLSELRNEAIVLRGRCYEQESVPFGGVDSLVDALSEYLLGLSSSDVDRLLTGGVANVARVFPVLCRVRQVAAQRVDGPILNAATLRDQAFGELVRLVATLGRARMLVLFLDDLQWIDPDSLALIRQILQAKTLRCLFVSTMRTESAARPDLAALLDGFQRVEVSRLSSDESLDVCRALATLQGEMREAVLREAGGHPLFLAELLRSARAGKLEQHASARLQDVLWDRISERDVLERQFLEMAALAGTPTPYVVLAQAAGLDLGECATRLAGLRAAQLVRVSRVDEERCVEPYHDRVREAVMERLRDRGEAHVARLHRALGRALRAATPEPKLASRIFTIVQHLNVARGQVELDGEKRELAELNLAASRQAYLATAFERAREYACIGLEQLGTDGWSRAYPLCRDLHLVRMEAECVEGHRDAARASFDAARVRMQDPEEKAGLYASWIGFETTSGRFFQALDAGREVLQELGAKLPAPARKIDILAEYAKARWAQRGRSADALASLPESHDPVMQGVLQILSALSPPAYFVEPDLLPWLMLRMARMTFKAGVSRWSSTGMVGYGMVLSGAFGKYEEGAAFGRLGMMLADRFENPRMRPEAYFVNGNFLLPWVRPYREAFECLQRAFELAGKYGVTKDEMYAGVQQTSLLYLQGADLRAVKERGAWGREMALQRSSEHLASLADLLMRYAHSLRGEAPGMDDPSLARSPQAEFVRHLVRADLAYLAGDLEGAEQDLSRASKLQETVFSMAYLVDLRLLDVMVAARRCDDASIVERSRRMATIGLNVRALAGWAKSCPANFEPHALLARAELLRVSGRGRAAAAAYDDAAAAARASGSAKREALAYELAMKHSHARGDQAGASRYRTLAVAAYRRWGATTKAQALDAGRA
jgi:predicted ATPase